MNFVKENCSRKIDSLGRISIPKGMRDRLEIMANDEMEFFTFDSPDGDTYICMTNHRPSKNRYEIAFNVLQELNCDIPEELYEKIE